MIFYELTYSLHLKSSWVFCLINTLHYINNTFKTHTILEISFSGTFIDVLERQHWILLFNCNFFVLLTEWCLFLVTLPIWNSCSWQQSKASSLWLTSIHLCEKWHRRSKLNTSVLTSAGCWPTVFEMTIFRDQQEWAFFSLVF